MELDVTDISQLEIMIHATDENAETVELEKTEVPHKGVHVMDHEDYEGPEITLTLGSIGGKADEVKGNETGDAE